MSPNGALFLLLLTFFYDLSLITQISAGGFSNLNNKNKNFLKLLQENLRRNNDDYAEANLLAWNPYLGMPSARRSRPEHTGRDGRRANHLDSQFSDGYDWNHVDSAKRMPILGLPDVNTKLIRKPRKESPKMLGNVSKFMVGGNKNEVRVVGMMENDQFSTNKDIKEKRKDFLDRNKELLKGFFNNKRLKEDNTSVEATRRDPSASTHEDNDITAHKVVLRMGPQVGYEKGPILRDQTTTPANLPDIPEAHMLDMAPAKGAKIDILREKDRLCYRSVLLPEGPKYDANGKIYLSEHDPKVALDRDFEMTQRPSLWLPRCCNCCKKSVLGCE